MYFKIALFTITCLGSFALSLAIDSSSIVVSGNWNVFGFMGLGFIWVVILSFVHHAIIKTITQSIIVTIVICLLFGMGLIY
jgi:hypothetical protein